MYWPINVNDSFLYEKLVELFDVSILEQIGRIRRDSSKKSTYYEKVDRIKSRLFINEKVDFNEVVSELKCGILIHSRNNPINEFRVDVICNFKQIGYLPDIISEEASELLDSDEIINCDFAEIEEEKIWIYLSRVRVEI